MAQQKKLDDDEFWLPTDILTEDDLLMDYRADSIRNQRRCGFNSYVSSPVDSVNGSTETDSDEEDYVSGLTRNMRKTSLQSFDLPSAKGRMLYGSPISALSGYGFSSAASPTEAKTAEGWDLLYAAAEEVARLKMVEEIASIQSRKFVPKPQKPTPPLRNACPVPSFYLLKSQNDARLAYLQLQATQFQRMKQLQQQQLMKRGIWANGPSEFHLQNTPTHLHAPTLPENWPSLQQSTQRRANSISFLGDNAGMKKERKGTGVFLPRCISTAATETRKKQAGFLLPEKMNPNLESNCDVSAYTRLHNKPNFPSAANQQLRLPQEWSY